MFASPSQRFRVLQSGEEIRKGTAEVGINPKDIWNKIAFRTEVDKFTEYQKKFSKKAASAWSDQKRRSLSE